MLEAASLTCSERNLPFVFTSLPRLPNVVIWRPTPGGSNPLLGERGCVGQSCSRHWKEAEAIASKRENAKAYIKETIGG